MDVEKAIRCMTENEAIAFVAWAKENGYYWAGGESMDQTHWNHYNRNTYYLLHSDGRLQYGNYRYIDPDNGKILVDFSGSVFEMIAKGGRKCSLLVKK